MSEVTSILGAAAHGDPHAAEQLLPMVYNELRKLAAARLAQEKPGFTKEHQNRSGLIITLNRSGRRVVGYSKGFSLL